MREYDNENVRLYTPVLQRIIILVAVIIAVPVVMWTITSFVRTYVAPPKVPTFQPISDSTAAAQPSDGLQATSAPVPQVAQTVTTSPAPAAALQPQTGSANVPMNTTMNAPMAAPRVAATAQPMAAPPAPAAMPAMAPASAAPDASPATGATGNPAPPATSSHDFAWPNPTNSPPAIPSAAESTPPAPDQSASNDNANADLPAVAPLTGKIPLPLRRPKIMAMAETAIPSAANSSVPPAEPPAAPPAAPSTVVAALPSAVPLPRARPASAPEPTPAPRIEVPAPSGGMDAGHY
jgi:hypothetical protein